MAREAPVQRDRLSAVAESSYASLARLNDQTSGLSRRGWLTVVRRQARVARI